MTGTALAGVKKLKKINVCAKNLKNRLMTLNLRDTVIVCYIINQNRGGIKNGN